MQVSNSVRRVAASGLFVAAALFGAIAGTGAEPVAAARPRPTPVPVPTVPAPSTLTVVSAESNRVIANIDPTSGYSVELEYVSGPLIPAGPVVGSPRPTGFNAGGVYWFTNVVADSTYVFRARRNYFFNSATGVGMTVTSAYTNFTFRTPTLAASRPSAPVISISRVSPYLLVSWAPSTDNVSSQTQLRYVYRVNGGPEIITCGSYCFGTTGATILPRPAAGSSIVVFAIDGAEIRSLPSNTLIAP